MFGVQLAHDRAVFTVFAHAQSVTLRLEHPGSRRAESRPMRATPDAGKPDVWTVDVPGSWEGWTYSYELLRDGVTLGGIIDPWARAVKQGQAYLLADTTPVAPRPALDPRDAIIYELHLRDFTRDPECGVRPDWRGRYLGLAERGTVLANCQSALARGRWAAEGGEARQSPTHETRPLSAAEPMVTGLDHILELGATVVQLMPVHAFALPYHPEYEWGYMPTDYQAPHPGYASDIEPVAAIREFKQLVSALHEAGLRVTLDVVFNHTYEQWPSRLHSFMALAPREYFRFKDDGTPWNGALCGNEFRSESAQGRRFIVESCLHWVREFGVDGFRFDLMGLIDRETLDHVVRELHAIDPTLLIYGEPWTAAETPIEGARKGTQRGKGFAIFSDEYRDAFRGNVFDLGNAGFLARGQNSDWVKKAVLGGVTSFADSPLESINYLECHDNHTLIDRLDAGARHFAGGPPSGLPLEEMIRLSAMGALALMTSQGIPFLHSGQEFGRTKNGHENSYNLGDQINNIRWRDKADRRRLYDYYRGAIALRRAHPMFRLSTGEEVRRAVKFLDDDLGLRVPHGVVAYHITDVTERDPWAEAIVVLNGTAEAGWVALPAGEWAVHPLDIGPRLGEHGRAKEWLEVAPRGGGVLYRLRESR